MDSPKFLNTRGLSELYLKFTLEKEIHPSGGQNGGGRYSSSQGASFSRSVYSISLSTEIIWNTYDITWVSIRGSCLWMFIFFIFFSYFTILYWFRNCKWDILLFYLYIWFYMVQNIPGLLASTQDKNRSLMRPWMICKFVHNLQHFCLQPLPSSLY